MNIVHRKGALHKVPDVLSRAFDEEVDEIAVTGVVDPDEWYSCHISSVAKDPSKYPDSKTKNNLLYKHRWKLVVPEADRKRALFEYHNPPHGGHLGAEKTRCRVAQTYF